MIRKKWRQSTIFYAKLTHVILRIRVTQGVALAMNLRFCSNLSVLYWRNKNVS